MIKVLESIIAWIGGLLILWVIIQVCARSGLGWADAELAKVKQAKQKRRTAKPRVDDTVPYDGSEFVDDGTFFEHV